MNDVVLFFLTVAQALGAAGNLLVEYALVVEAYNELEYRRIVGYADGNTDGVGEMSVALYPLLLTEVNPVNGRVIDVNRLEQDGVTQLAVVDELTIAVAGEVAGVGIDAPYAVHVGLEGVLVTIVGRPIGRLDAVNQHPGRVNAVLSAVGSFPHTVVILVNVIVGAQGTLDPFDVHTTELVALDV